MRERPPPEPNWLKSASLAWFGEALRTLDNLGLDEITYRNGVLKDRLFKSLALVYWNSILRCAEAARLPKRNADDLIAQVVGQHLEVDRATYNRWAADQVIPGSDKVFGTLVIVLKREIDEVGFPRNREVVREAMRRTLTMIRVHECGWDPREPGDGDLICAHWFLLHPNADIFLTESDEVSRGRVLRDVMEKVTRVSGRVTSLTEVQNAVSEWPWPYLLFRVGCPPSWTVFDVTA